MDEFYNVIDDTGVLMYDIHYSRLTQDWDFIYYLEIEEEYEYEEKSN